MVWTDGKPETQHYVGRAVLLRGFTVSADRDQVFLYDKHQSNGPKKPTSIGNVAAERDYYEAETEIGRVSIEAELKFLEDEAGKRFAKIRADNGLKQINAQDKGAIALFAATQFLRTPRMRLAAKQIREAVLKKAEAILPDDPSIYEIRKSLGKEALKLSSMEQILVTSHKLAALLLEHHWVVITDPEKRFWISDSPVVMHNEKDFGPYGTLGFALPGIQIYLPISADVVLGFWSQDILDELRDGEQDVLKTFRQAQARYTLGMNINRVELGRLLGEYQTALARVRKSIVALEEGYIEASNEHVTFLNWLQYVWSYRFLMSSKSDFSLADEIGVKHPELHEGIKVSA